MSDAVATSTSGAFLDYIPENWNPPDGGEYTTGYSWANLAITDNAFAYCLSRECIDNPTGPGLATVSTESEFAVMMNLERGSFCIDTI